MKSLRATIRCTRNRGRDDQWLRRQETLVRVLAAAYRCSALLDLPDCAAVPHPDHDGIVARGGGLPTIHACASFGAEPERRSFARHHDRVAGSSAADGADGA